MLPPFLFGYKHQQLKRDASSFLSSLFSLYVAVSEKGKNLDADFQDVGLR